ncbi:hypothetical protein FIN97_08915, partial [Yersinia pestis]
LAIMFGCAWLNFLSCLCGSELSGWDSDFSIRFLSCLCGSERKIIRITRCLSMSNGAKCVKTLFLVKYLSSIKINTLVIVIKRGSQESGGT